MPTYKCGNCDNDIEYGTKYCPECGTKISWPKEKKAKSVRKREKVKLPINPDNLYKVVPKNFFSKPYDVLLLLFSAGGIILSLVVSSRQKKILKWLSSLQTEECDLNVFKKNVMSIRRCGIWAIVLGIFAILLNLLAVFYPEIRLSGYQINEQSIAISILTSLGYIACACVGLGTGCYIQKRTTILLKELELDNEYVYEFEDDEVEESEMKGEETNKNVDSEEDEFDDEF